MDIALKTYLRFTLILLLVTVSLGVVASWSFLYPETYNQILPFYQLRPLHVSSALFWIISGATGCIIYFKKEAFKNTKPSWTEKGFIILWALTIIIILTFYAFKKFGGREYWEFPPLLSVPLLISWTLLMFSYFKDWRNAPPKQPLYIWMWSTGIFFFLVTFIEQNLWHLSWFRESLLREITVQWKSNGSMVGSWNQMIYGTALFIMVKISADNSIAQSKKAFAFYFLGLTNLMFNWGHHIYNLPAAGWIRHISYAISMTEWLIFISIVRGFRKKLEERRKYKYLLSYKFLVASEFWVFLNLGLALMMSVPAINRYTHGTHITVAHAMGTTIGINTMILLAAFGYMFNTDALKGKSRNRIVAYYWVTQVSLMIFWLSLIVAGVLKGYRSTALQIQPFQEMMSPVIIALKVFSYAGLGLLIGLGGIAVDLMRNWGTKPPMERTTNKVYIWKQESQLREIKL